MSRPGGPRPDAADPRYDSVVPPETRRVVDLVEPLTRNRHRIAVTAVCIAASVGAWILRFAQDDAFITYRFSRNFAEGRGLVFNPGQRVEGYTNFLWTVYLAIPERMGWSTPMFSVISGIVIMVATILVAYRLARGVFGDDNLALVVIVALVANVTFLGYGTSGMETMLQTLLVTAVAVLVVVPATPTTRQRLSAGVLGGLAILTRLDSTVLVGVMFAVALWRTWGGRRTDSPRPAAKLLIAQALQMGAPVLALVVPWLIWKLDYYGNLLPNTFYAKSTSNPFVPFAYGIVYVLAFFASYAAFLFIGRWRRHRGSLFERPAVPGLAVIVGVWVFYICYVGADFMEFRFMVPILPVLALVAGFLVDRFRSTGRQVVLVAILLMTSGLHAVLPGMQYPVLTFKDIRHWPTDSPTSWSAMGKLLAREFPGELEDTDRPTIAITALGVVAYESNLRTVDMLGLADADIARDGDPIPLYYPGHVRMATVDQLVDKGVDLVIGQPTPIEPIAEDSVTLAQLVGIWPATDLRKLPDEAQVVEVMLAPQRAWYLIQLGPHPQVDAAIERNGWRTLEIERSCDLRELKLEGLPRWVFRQAAQRTCPGL